MENPEEVLQALDEFQKLRPSEIPPELEDYLCFVAKTGNPVYQWRLIKALFREKLVQVMTEFYESCPSLDLTPCPNVEQFNYDSMKRNLVERLESFANAPFTVQRICELLTSPRKEYNRIDKFMRAIEKNILVVSTKEPGPFGRRSENGENLVNGSLEDEEGSHHGQTSTNDVEMDHWDCAAATTSAPLHLVGDNEETTAALKAASTSSSSSSSSPPSSTTFDKASESVVADDGTAPSFIGSTAEFGPTEQLQQQQPQEPTAQETSAAVVQNLTNVDHEAQVVAVAAAIVGDVSEAIMNEDTSSQPSLELESDDSNSSEAKKLQTTFQAKDFKIDQTEADKTYIEEGSLIDKPEEESAEPKVDENEESIESVPSAYSSEELSNDGASDSQDTEKIDHPVVSETDNIEKTDDAQTSENSESNLDMCDGDSQVNFETKNVEEESTKTEEVTIETPEEIKNNDKEVDEVKETSEVEPKVQESIENVLIAAELEKSEEVSQKQEQEAVLSEVSTPIIKSSPVELTDSTETTTKVESTELTIEEAMDDDSKTKVLVPDLISAVEESKEIETTASLMEIPEETNVVLEVKNGLDSLSESPPKHEQVEDNQMIITEDITSTKANSEWMEVDNEALLSGTQDEPMEQDATEVIDS